MSACRLPVAARRFESRVPITRTRLLRCFNVTTSFRVPPRRPLPPVTCPGGSFRSCTTRILPGRRDTGGLHMAKRAVEVKGWLSARKEKNAARRRCGEHTQAGWIARGNSMLRHEGALARGEVDPRARVRLALAATRGWLATIGRTPPPPPRERYLLRSSMSGAEGIPSLGFNCVARVGWPMLPARRTRTLRPASHSTTTRCLGDAGWGAGRLPKVPPHAPGLRRGGGAPALPPKGLGAGPQSRLIEAAATPSAGRCWPAQGRKCPQTPGSGCG